MGKRCGAGPHREDYIGPMNNPVHLSEAGLTARQCWFLGAAWLLVALKCVLVTWAASRWSVPFDPLWIVLPTLLFAGLATFLWVTHRA